MNLNFYNFVCSYFIVIRTRFNTFNGSQRENAIFVNISIDWRQCFYTKFYIRNNYIIKFVNNFIVLNYLILFWIINKKFLCMLVKNCSLY